jgi:hypothetical protein
VIFVVSLVAGVSSVFLRGFMMRLDLHLNRFYETYAPLTFDGVDELGGVRLRGFCGTWEEENRLGHGCYLCASSEGTAHLWIRCCF